MAISRSLMNRQLQADGGIMQVAPREKFGLGSKLKKFVRKIIPNEVADIAVKAAPFVAPFNPAVAAAMSGLGTFDQTGSISAGLKSGAMNYGGGQLARYAGGAGFQGNPFGDGGAFTGGLQGFKGGFSSPIGTDTGLGKFFSNRGTQGVQGIDMATGGADGVGVIQDAATSNVDMITGGADGVGIIQDTIIDKSVVTKDPGFLKNIFDGISNQDYGKVGNTILEGSKKFGKAMFTNKDGSIDKAAVMGAIAFAGSYAEAQALAADAGIEITPEEYDEATKEDKKAEYASYLTNFFGGQKDGGRIGFKLGSKPEDAEVGIMTIDVEAGDDEDEEDMMMAGGITFSSAEKSYLFRKLGGAGGADRSFTMPQLYGILKNPNSPSNIDDAKVLKEIAIMGLGEGQKDGGRIGFSEGADLEQRLRDLADYYMERGLSESEAYETAANELYKADGGRIGYKGGANRVSELLILRDNLLANDEDVSDIEAEIFQLTGKTFKSVGGISDIPTGKIRKNNAGVTERDYREEGGFVPVGIKERADDVPAMLSKNEFVMTADAVRGIGNGSVEEGSKKLYNTMKQAEKVGKA